MARRRYQTGCLLVRGKRRKVWVGRWWEDVIQPDGTLGRARRSEVLGFVSEIPRQREARKLLEARIRPLNEGRHRPQSTLTLSAFVAGQFEPAALPTLRPSTQQVYRVLLQKHLLPRFGDRRLCDVTRADIQRFALEKLQQGQSWESANKLRNLMSKVLGTAVSWGYLAENPARGVKMPERTTKRPRTYLATDEVKSLLVALEEPARTVALLAVLGGLRIGEILALRWGRIDFLGETLRVEETCYRGIFGSPKTRASRRQVPLAPAVTDALFLHRSRARDTSPDALVFATRKGTPLSAGNLHKRDLLPACKTAELKPIGWHALRHTHSTILHSLGVPLKVAQAQLGHSRLGTTFEIYTHTLGDAQRDAVLKLQKVLDPNGPKSSSSAERQNGKPQLVQ